MARIAFRTDLPDQLAMLAELALDLRWTWSHAGDDLWRMINPEVWERTRNPWTLLQDVSREQLETMRRQADEALVQAFEADHGLGNHPPQWGRLAPPGPCAPQ